MQGLVRGYWPVSVRSGWWPLGKSQLRGYTLWLAALLEIKMLTSEGVSSFPRAKLQASQALQGSSPRLWKHLNDPGRLCFNILFSAIKLGCFSVICVPASSCHLPSSHSLLHISCRRENWTPVPRTICTLKASSLEWRRPKGLSCNNSKNTYHLLRLAVCQLLG